MIIKTYNTNDDINVANKSLQNENEIEMKLKNDMEILTPVILLSGDIPTFNYCYIPQFNRYYFADRPAKGNNNIYYISLKCDRLMSFKNQIKNSFGTVVKSENHINKYINDDTWVTDVRFRTDVLNFPNGFNDNPTFVLVTAGATI